MAKIIKFNCAILVLGALVGISFLSFKTIKGEIDNLDRFVLFAGGDIHLAENVQVESGDIGSNSEIFIAENSTASSSLFADKIHLAENSLIKGNVSYNQLQQAESSQILGEKITPVSLPIAQLPTIPDFETGDQSLVITGEQTISPGNYNKIEIKENAKLTLEAGTYNVNKFYLREASFLLFSGFTVVNIKNEFKGSEKAVIQDLDNLFSHLTVNYQNTKSINFGKQSSLTLKIIAPQAKVYLGKESNFQGSIYAKEIYIAEQTKISVLPFGPPPAPVGISGAPGVRPCPGLPGGRNIFWACNLYITISSADIIWDSSLDPNFESYRLYRTELPDVTTNDILIYTTTTQGDPPNILFYRDNNLEMDKTYYYRLFVFNKYGLSTGSNEIIVKTFSQPLYRVSGIPEPGDTQYPSDVAVPYYAAPQNQYRCLNPNPFYYWTCQNYYYTFYGSRIDEFSQVYKYRYFRVSINNNQLGGADNLKFYLRNSEVWTTYYSTQDKDYRISIPAYGFSVNIPQASTRTIQMQVFTGVYNIILEALGIYQPEAGALYVSS